MVILDTLTRYVFLEIVGSLKFKHQKPAFERIMTRLKLVYPSFNGGQILFDGGPEWTNKSFGSLLKIYNLKRNIVKKRVHRGSKGVGTVESAIRRIRTHLERMRKEQGGKKKLHELMTLVEDVCNSETLSSHGMSAKEALMAQPMEIMMISESKKLQRRKYLREAVQNQNYGRNNFSIGNLVRVKVFVDKQFSSSTKESYGQLSPYYVILDIDKNRALWTYKIGNIFNFEALPGSYSFHELKLMNISLFDAIEKESKNIKNVVKKDDLQVWFRIDYLDMLICANLSILHENSL